MSNREILEKAIQKAIGGGYDRYLGRAAIELLPQVFTYGGDGADIHWTRGLIFNHDFAKALWGEERSWNKAEGEEDDDDTGYSLHIIPYWQGMLQQMVIADDPIKYLGENI